MTDALAFIEQTEPRVLPEARAFVADTCQSLTVHQMARAWDAISYPVTTADVPLASDPDDFPLTDWRVEVWPNGRGDL